MNPGWTENGLGGTTEEFLVSAVELSEWDLLEWLLGYILLCSVAEHATHTKRILCGVS